MIYPCPIHLGFVSFVAAGKRTAGHRSVEGARDGHPHQVVAALACCARPHAVERTLC